MLPFSYGVPLPEALPVVLYYQLPSIHSVPFKFCFSALSVLSNCVLTLLGENCDCPA